MRASLEFDGDEFRDHDDECSWIKPCSECEWEENARREAEWAGYQALAEGEPHPDDIPDAPEDRDPYV